jgi:Ser-tRNA(Ala) deacylase AlaX
MGGALYLEDSYLRENDPKIISMSGKEVVLDLTIFYPKGGGQPGDTGSITTASGIQYRVVSGTKKEGKIVHEIASEPGQEIRPLAPGETVHCVLDWERRYKLMRMHTAAHALAATMHKELGVLITGNQLEEDKTRFDFQMPEFDRQKFEDVVQKANLALSSGVELKTYTLPRDEAMRIPGVVKLANAMPPSITELRIVEIPGIDIQADGGTHVRSLKEVGKISILRFENKGKDNRRIYFTLT